MTIEAIFFWLISSWTIHFLMFFILALDFEIFQFSPLLDLYLWISSLVHFDMVPLFYLWINIIFIKNVANSINDYFFLKIIFICWNQTLNFKDCIHSSLIVEIKSWKCKFESILMKIKLFPSRNSKYVIWC